MKHPRVSRRKEILKIRAEINAKEAKETAAKINKAKGWFFEMLCYAMLSHFSCVRLCVTPETTVYQAPLSLGFSRQEHWSGLPFPSPVHESEK